MREGRGDGPREGWNRNRDGKLGEGQRDGGLL